MEESVENVFKNGKFSRTDSEHLFFKNSVKYSFLELMKLLDSNNIPYFASSGTLLGAVRHNGIIPWDTDIDIGIMDYDFKKLFNVIQNSTYFYIWQNGLKGSQTYENRVHSINEMYGNYDNLHITLKDKQSIGNNRTVCDIEIFILVNKIPKRWLEYRSSYNFSSEFLMHKTEYFAKQLDGAMNIPKDLAFPLRKIKFYDLMIPIFKESEIILKVRHGNDCLDYGPNDKNRYLTGSRKIIDFSPL